MANGLGKYNISSYIDDLIHEHVQSLYPNLVSTLIAYIAMISLLQKIPSTSGCFLMNISISPKSGVLKSKSKEETSR
mgnify:CR=1 FL=1